jgi:hypothetical protein
MRILKMKKTIISLGLMMAMGTSHAVLVNGSMLNIGEGSFFTMGGGLVVRAPGFDGNFITSQQGLVLAAIQTPSGSHSGIPGSTVGENPTVDVPWVFFGNTGMHGTESATHVLSASGNTGTVDMSGWVIAWNGLDSASGKATIPMGSGAWNGALTDGVAQITCALVCQHGDTYTLDYSATVPDGDPSFFGNTQYYLHLTGTISAVPEPDIVISIADQGSQECSEMGGHTVTVTPVVHLIFDGVLDRIEWKVDGEMVATGDIFSEYLSLGDHVISATAFTVSGKQDTTSTNITIVDTVAPEIDAAFIDRRSGSEITEINKKHTSFVRVKMIADDVCDASPSIQGMAGFKLFDGDRIKIKGKRDKVVLKTSMLEMEVTAEDASGNSSQAVKVLSINP